LQQVQHALVSTGQSVAQAMQQAPGQVFQMLRGQAGVLAYSDVFFITGLMALAIIPAALFMTSKPSESKG